MWPLLLSFFGKKSAKIGIAVVIVMVLGYGFYYINGLHDKLVEKVEQQTRLELLLEEQQNRAILLEQEKVENEKRISLLSDNLSREKSRNRQLNILLNKERENAKDNPEEGVHRLNEALTNVLTKLDEVIQ